MFKLDGLEFSKLQNKLKTDDVHKLSEGVDLIKKDLSQKSQSNQELSSLIEDQHDDIETLKTLVGAPVPFNEEDFLIKSKEAKPLK